MQCFSTGGCKSRFDRFAALWSISNFFPIEIIFNYLYLFCIILKDTFYLNNFSHLFTKCVFFSVE